MVNRELEQHMRIDERVLWRSGTMRFSLLDEENRPALLILWIAAAMTAIGAAVIGVYLHTPGSYTGAAVVVLAAGLSALGPVMQRRQLLEQSCWITDQRVMVMSRSGTVYYMERDEVDRVRMVGERADQQTLVLGSALAGERPGRLRWRAGHPMLHPCDDGSGHAQGLVFYCVRNAEGAVETLQRRKQGCRVDREKRKRI